MTLAYYVGAYGPTIRLDTQTLEELKAARQLFGRLAAGEVLQEDLCKALVCRADAIHSLIVQSVPEPPGRALQSKGDSVRGPLFVWTNDSAGWQECVEKVDALIVSGSPGHQYLTNEGTDDALVELCYRE